MDITEIKVVVKMVLKTVEDIMKEYRVKKWNLGDTVVFEILSEDFTPAPRVFVNVAEGKIEVEIPLSEPYPVEELPVEIVSRKRHAWLLNRLEQIIRDIQIELTDLKIYMATRNWELYDTVGNKWEMETLVAIVELDTSSMYNEYLEFLLTKSGEVLVTDVIRIAMGKTKWNRLIKTLTELERLGGLVSTL